MVKDVVAVVRELDVRPGMRLTGPHGWREISAVQFEVSGPKGSTVVQYEDGRVRVLRSAPGVYFPRVLANRRVEEECDGPLDLLTRYAGRQVEAESATWWAACRDGSDTLDAAPVGLAVVLITPSRVAYERKSLCGDPKPHPNHEWSHPHESEARWCPGETPGVEAFR